MIPQQQNPLPEIDYNKKIALRPDEIMMKFISARLVNNEYLCFYNITITPRISRIDPRFPIMAKNIDQLSYRKAIEENIPVQDRKFIKLKTIDSFGAILKFDVKEWLNQAFLNCTPKIEQIGFKKTYKARIAPPRVMAYDVFMKSWQDYICKEFSKWIVVNHKESGLIEKILPDVLKKKVKQNINELFDFAYDSGTNNMIVSLKPIWTMSLMYAATKLGEKDPRDVNKSDLEKNKNFFYNVEKELKSFHDDKWKTFLKKKNLGALIK